MSTAAYYAIHYGKEYLAWSIRSIQDAVDEIFVFYTPSPSYGHNSGAQCPDSREELSREARRFLHPGKRIHWVDGRWPSEGHHRSAALDHIKKCGHRLVLVVDADEVWPEGAASRALNHAEQSNCAGRWLCNFTNFWRTFDRVVLDAFKPIRVVDFRHPLQSDGHMDPSIPGVLHFGYAQSEAIMRYKWTCHGHQAELRPGWSEKFSGWKEGDTDLHPCVNNLWDLAHPTPIEASVLVQQALGDHPYFGLEIIR
jgi:hypothetical protein